MEHTKGELRLIRSPKHPGDIFIKIKGTKRNFLCKFYGGKGTEISPSEAEANVCHFIQRWQTNDTPAEDRYGRDVKPDKVKPLAQYLFEHDCEYADVRSSCEYFQQALDAYESTENVKIRIERV